jgi:hypothetical protein
MEIIIIIMEIIMIIINNPTTKSIKKIKTIKHVFFLILDCRENVFKSRNHTMLGCRADGS